MSTEANCIPEAQRLAGKDLQELIESEERFRALIESSYDVILILNPDGSIKYTSPSGRRLFPFPAENSFMATGFSEVIHPDDLHLVIDAQRKLLAAPGAVDRIPCYRGIGLEGKVIFLEATGTNCLHVPGVEGIVINVRDITEQHLAEENLRKLNRELEERVALRTDELKAANDRLTHEIAEKSRFVSMVSHEVRTPLATILSSAELLQNYAERLPPERLAELRQHIIDAARLMAANMENILQLSRVDSARFEPNPQHIRFGDLCRQVVDEIEAASQPPHTINLTVAAEAAEEVFLDVALFRSMLSNVVGNAVKFSPEHSRVEVSVFREREDALIIVSDQGPGIPEAEQAHLFQAFRRGSNVTGIPGTGLGLTIVKRCVEILHGTITLDSAVAKGTTVTLRLPLYKTQVRGAT